MPTSELPGSAQRTATRWAERGAVPPRSSATWTIGAAGAGWLPPEHEEARCGPGPGEEVPASLRARSPPTRPGPRVPAAGKEQEVWGRHTHANPAREAGRPHPGPPPLWLPRAPAPGALPLRQPARARLDPQKRPAHCRRTPGSSVLPRRLSARTALHFAALHPRRSPDRLSHGPRAVEHTGNLATVTLRQPHPAESRLEPGRTLKPLALQIRIHFSQHEKPFIAQ